MGFLANLNKISKEIKGGFVNGQMSSAIKYTMFNSKSVSSEPEMVTEHDGEHFYFDKHNSFIIRENKEGEVQKFKILEILNLEAQKEEDKETLFKTLKGSDVYSFTIKYGIPGVMSSLRITSSCSLWEPFEGQLAQVFNGH